MGSKSIPSRRKEYTENGNGVKEFTESGWNIRRTKPEKIREGGRNIRGPELEKRISAKTEDIYGDRNWKNRNSVKAEGIYGDRNWT